MIKKTYREVPLPKHCTRAVLRKMKRKLYNTNFYTCRIYSHVCSGSWANEVLEREWAKFMLSLGISITGSGFIYYCLPEWFREISEPPSDNNNYRYQLIRNILKECYNE